MNTLKLFAFIGIIIAVVLVIFDTLNSDYGSVSSKAAVVIGMVAVLIMLLSGGGGDDNKKDD